jgi:hypothetical protein
MRGEGKHRIKKSESRPPSGPGNDRNPGIKISRWKSEGRPAALALSLTVLVVYGLTLPNSVTGGDSGELICAASDLGVAHPPGYPLWTMLAHLFTLIPHGSLAWRASLFSAVCGAGAAGLLCRTTQIWTGQWWVGLLAGGLFAFSPLTWTWSIQAEVFALNNLLLAALLWAAAGFGAVGAASYARLAGLAAGLALANHHTSVFVIGPLAAWFCWRLYRPQDDQPRAPRLRLAFEAGAMTALGLLCYLYLPLAGKFSHGLIWGEPSTWHGFLTHLLRREYGTFQLAAGTTATEVSLPLLLERYFATAASRLMIIGLPLALIGLAWSIFNRGSPRVSRSLGIAVAAVLCLYLVGFQSLVNLSPADPLLAGVLARFWMLPDLLLALLAGLGIAAIAAKWPAVQRAAAGLSVAIVLAQAGTHWREQSKHSAVVASYGRAILSELTPDAILLVRGDLPSNAVRYVQRAEGFRPDVIVLDQEMLTRGWYVAQMARRHPRVVFPGTHYDPAAPDGFSLASFVSANPAPKAIWLYPEPKPGDPSVAQLTIRPEGLDQSVHGAGAQPPDLEAWDRNSTAVLKQLEAQFAPLCGEFPPGAWEHVVGLDYWSALHRHALAWLRIAFANPGADAPLQYAQAAYEAFVTHAPGPIWYAWKNLALIYERLAVQNPNFRPQAANAWRRFLEQAPANDPDREAAAAALARLEGNH